MTTSKRVLAISPVSGDIYKQHGGQGASGMDRDRYERKVKAAVKYAIMMEF